MRNIISAILEKYFKQKNIKAYIENIGQGKYSDIDICQFIQIYKYILM